MLETTITIKVKEILHEILGADFDSSTLLLQKTRKEFEGDFTLVVFPLSKVARMSPDEIAVKIGDLLLEKEPIVKSYNVIKGFLNIVLKPFVWVDFLQTEAPNSSYGFIPKREGKPVVLEYSSPNTNKPLHLGHVRNNLLGFSVSRILDAAGNNVAKVNLVNDRGIHICKSMIAWQKFANGETPASFGKKGDKLVGDYYVKFEAELRAQSKLLMEESSISEEDARKTAPLMREAQEMLQKWEEGHPETIEIWKTMNSWVYEGFDATYDRLGVSFDKVYYESETYLHGKKLVEEGLEMGVFERRADGSVWVDLTDEGLDEKLLLRSDGTSVYITQDLGTAQLRCDDFDPGKLVYVVGNEQNYHFDVLKKVLKKLGKHYADGIFHLSYGMVELPEGKMKSREGTVVDADDLMDEMVKTAKQTTEELGKVQDLSEPELNELYKTVGLGALKYFMLKVDPKKTMLFNPTESIDFNGHTGPFIQYTHARIRSILRSAGSSSDTFEFANTMPSEKLSQKERALIRSLYQFPTVISEAANELNPASVANYAYDIAKEYNQFYHDHSVLNEPDPDVSKFRIALSKLTATTLKNAMWLLGIDVPERM